MYKEEFKKNKTSWVNSLMSGISLDENQKEVPWMTYKAISYLKDFVKKDQEIFEFGSGASTLFFARNCKNVTSIETNKRWKSIIEERLKENNLTNSQINLMEDGLENENYENFLLRHCEEHSDVANQRKKQFDIIIIDSIKRYKCSTNILSSLKKGGIIILDDSERKNYKKIFDYYQEQGLKRKDFEGISPGQLRIKNTTIFSY
jgi:predicted O-methyltransferase YrrM